VPCFPSSLSQGRSHSRSRSRSPSRFRSFGFGFIFRLVLRVPRRNTGSPQYDSFSVLGIIIIIVKQGLKSAPQFPPSPPTLIARGGKKPLALLLFRRHTRDGAALPPDALGFDKIVRGWTCVPFLIFTIVFGRSCEGDRVRLTHPVILLIFRPEFSREVTRCSFLVDGINPFHRDGVYLERAK